MSIEKRGFLYGLFTTACLIIFFFIMDAFGLTHNYNLRILNAFLLFGGIYLSIRAQFKNYPIPNSNKKRTTFSFINEGTAGLVTTFTTAILFSGFVGIFLGIDNEFLSIIRNNEPQGQYLTAPAISFLIFLEASVSGFVFTWLVVQILKEKYSVNRDKEIQEAERIKGQ